MAGGELNLRADKRTPFWPDTIDFEAMDLSGLTLLMHIRRAPGETGSPLLALAGTSSPTEGLSIATATVEGILYSKLSIRINESTLEALALGTPPDEPLVLYYDLHIGSGVAKKRWLYGEFVIDPGVTI